MPIPGYVFQNYQGNFVQKPTSFCKPSTMAPAVVSFDIDWSVYINGAVNCNLNLNSTQMGQLDKINGIIINNLNNGFDIFVEFPDTGLILTCPAYQTIQRPAYTNALTFNVYSNFKGQPGITTITALNFAPNPFEDASQFDAVGFARRTSTTDIDYGPAAFGDQLQFVRLNNDGQFQVIMQSNDPQPNVTIFWKSVQVYVIGTGAGAALFGINSSLIFEASWNAQAVDQGRLEVLRIEDMQLRLPASDDIVVQLSVVSGTCAIETYVTYAKCLVA